MCEVTEWANLGIERMVDVLEYKCGYLRNYHPGTVSLDFVTSLIVTTSSCRIAGVVAPKADNPMVSFRIGLSKS